MNTYSDQRTEVSVFGAGFTNDNTHGRLCNLSGDHISSYLDTIASGSRGGCDGIASSGRICGVRDINLNGGITSGIRAFDGGRISGVPIVGCVASGGHGGCNAVDSGGRHGCNGDASGGRSVCHGIASSCCVSGVRNVDLDRGIVSGICTFDNDHVNNARTASNPAINVNVSVLLVSLVNNGLHGGAAFALL